MILNIIGNSANSLESLAPNCMTFVYTFYGMESNLTKKGYAILTLGEL
jgi:hypothetical protein